MATIAVLGIGLLGRGFAENLIAKGHSVRVWNRTASRCSPLVERGATLAQSPADAVRGAERVHLVLAEDTAVDAVIAALRPALGQGVYVVDHSTNLPHAVARRFAGLRAAGIRYIHAPVFMGPANARDATGIMLLSGPDDDQRALRPALETMTGRVLSLGADPDKAAKMKITGNGMLVMLTAAIGDLLSLGRSAGVPAEEIVALFDDFSPSPAALGRRALSAANNPVGFALGMARKDVRLMLETAGDAGLVILPAVAAAMDRAIADGRGDEDYSVIATHSR